MIARRRIAAVALALLTGCSMAPAYQPPNIGVPQNFSEAEGWTAAQPMDGLPRGNWWEVFNDPILNDLEARSAAASPTLAAALARYDQARAAARATAYCAATFSAVSPTYSP